VLDDGQADERQDGERGEHQETELIVARVLLRQAQARSEDKSADTARHADETRHDADLVAKTLRYELEHRAVAHAEGQHGAGEQRERQINALRMKTRGDQRERGERVHGAQRLDAADPVRERAADGPNQRADEHARGGEVAGLHGTEPVVGIEVDGQG
jgi:hypothetical protein